MPEEEKPRFGMRAGPEEATEPTGATDGDEIKATKTANRFDIRRLIGGLFLVYGVVLTLMGIFGSEHVKNKADGINIDLYTGIGMLVFAGLMLFWAFARPVRPEPPETRGRGSGRIRRAPAVGKERIEEVLAMRAVARLDFPTLLSFTPDPLGDFATGRFDRLARAELASVGLRP